MAILIAGSSTTLFLLGINLTINVVLSAAIPTPTEIVVLNIISRVLDLLLFSLLFVFLLFGVIEAMKNYRMEMRRKKKGSSTESKASSGGRTPDTANTTTTSESDFEEEEEDESHNIEEENAKKNKPKEGKEKKEESLQSNSKDSSNLAISESQTPKEEGKPFSPDPKEAEAAELEKPTYEKEFSQTFTETGGNDSEGKTPKEEMQDETPKQEEKETDDQRENWEESRGGGMDTK